VGIIEVVEITFWGKPVEITVFKFSVFSAQGVD